MRSIVMMSASLALLAACGGETPAAPVEPTPPVEPAPVTAAPDPTALETPAQADVRGMSVMCGGSQMKVAFDATKAVVTNDDGTTIDLPAGPADANTEPGVTVYTDGKMSFAKSGGGDTPTVIRFARGRMAWQDCAIAVN
jgi:hypothetical protein